jgi:predicted DCC family thiol-disulfide oxidoreductase YuxK
MKSATNKAIILFDGVCNLCSTSVQFILKHNKKHHFIFATLQSDVARDILLHYPTKITKKDSILLIQNNKIYTESTAVLLIAKKFTGFWKLLQIFWIIPKFIRDILYRFIAKNRYRWFREKNVCIIPDKSVKNRFL